MLPDEACSSLSLENILFMMLNTKPLTKPLVVISDNTHDTVMVTEEPRKGQPGEDFNLFHPLCLSVRHVETFTELVYSTLLLK